MKTVWPIIAIAAVLLAGCAGDPGYQAVGRGGYGHGGGGDEARAGHGLPNEFISPAGKPYRAQAGAPYPVAAWFAEADADHDGRITRAEFEADAARFFDDLDTDHDGIVDGFEIQHYEQDVAPEIQPRIEGLGAGEGLNLALGKRTGSGEAQIGASRGSHGRGAAGDLQPQGAGLFGLLNEPEPVSAADANFDGKITKAEFLAAADRRFEALDPKHTGALTLTALPKTPVQLAIEDEAKRAAKAPR